MANIKAKGKYAEVEILTDTYRMKGTLFLPLASEGGYNSRLSDFLNDPSKQFLPITNVTVEVLPDPAITWQTGFLAVNKRVVTMVRAIKEQVD